MSARHCSKWFVYMISFHPHNSNPFAPVSLLFRFQTEPYSCFTNFLFFGIMSFSSGSFKGLRCCPGNYNFHTISSHDPSLVLREDGRSHGGTTGEGNIGGGVCVCVCVRPSIRLSICPSIPLCEESGFRIFLPMEKAWGGQEKGGSA